MKSLSAWSVDREDAARIGRLEEFEREEAAVEFDAALGDISTILMETISLYALADMQRRQKEMLQQWVTRQGDLVQSSISEQSSRLKESLVSAMANAVEPLLRDVIEKKAIDDFCDALEKAAAKTADDNAVVTVPQRLHTALLEEMTKRGLQVRVQSAESEEISVECGHTHIETKILTVVEELNGVLLQ